MNRLRTLAANFQLQKEASLTRHADGRRNALSGGVLQERVHGAAYYFAATASNSRKLYASKPEVPAPATQRFGHE